AAPDSRSHRRGTVASSRLSRSSAESGNGDRVRGGQTALMRRDRLEEVAAFECPQSGVRPSANRRGAWDVPQERDLADVPGRLLELELPGKVDLQRPIMQDVEAVTMIAGVEQRLPGAELDVGQSCGEILERLRGKRGQERDGA